MAGQVYPSAYFDNIKRVDFQALKKAGYDGLIFDIDNTLTGHGAGATPEVKDFFASLHNMGFKTGIISNNHKGRVKAFADAVGGVFFVCDAKKPNPGAYFEVINKLKLPKDKVCFFGDQIFTDICGANKAGIKSVLLNPISPKEPFHIRLKRLVEMPIRRAYLKRHRINDLKGLL